MYYLIMYLIFVPLMTYWYVKYLDTPNSEDKIKTKYDDAIMIGLLWPFIAVLIGVLIGVLLVFLAYSLIHYIVMLILKTIHLPQSLYGVFDKIEQEYETEVEIKINGDISESIEKLSKEYESTK